MRSYRVKITNKPECWHETIKYIPILSFEFLVCASNKKQAEAEGIKIWLDNTKPRIETINKIERKAKI